MLRVSKSVAISLLGGLACALWTRGGLASGPRWITGPPYFNNSGNPVIWGISQIYYFTDPGDLSLYVNHAAADAIVASAAAVWNVPTAYVSLPQGGTLAEHVSAANSYITSGGPVFPADVQAANYAAMPVAVIYDSDGSITDMLLGSGASTPAECRQNGVIEDVDGITAAGRIQHAIVILNGRCTGPAPEQQLQLEYQLIRAFGRVLGLGWSQTNDNVFTRSPQPTLVQAQHWPILHPVDIICGPYTYQCMPNPFTLRDDDLGSVSGMYPMTGPWPPPAPTPTAGKQWTYGQAGKIHGRITFPTGQGMAGVNVVLRRWRGGSPTVEPYDDTSSVSGFLFRQGNGNPVTGTSASMAASMGTSDASDEGYYSLQWIPLEDPEGNFNGPSSGVLVTQPVNPLYTGAYAVGPYPMGTVEPSGAAESQTTQYPIEPSVYPWRDFESDLAVPANASSNCNSSSDGTETAPTSIDPSGWWTGVLCGYGHGAWSGFSMQAGRTATVEITALDDDGLATTQKAMPLIGAWGTADPPGTLPTVAATPSAFNTLAIGTTATHIVTNGSAQSLRIVLADARGDGRPDFAYRARVLYADSVTPAAVSTAGGLITITGEGFRRGNSVTINGVAATVVSWTSTAIAAIAPPVAVQSSAPVAIRVADLATGASTTISAALTYSASIAPDMMTLVTAPGTAVAVGAAATFAVRVTLADGVTPVAGLPVVFTWSGPAQITGCIASPCALVTDASGIAAANVTATSFGNISFAASALGLSQTAIFSAVARSVSAQQATEYVAAGSTVAWSPQAVAIQNAAPAAGLSVDWMDSNVLSGSPGFSISPAVTTADAQGIAQTSARLGPLAANVQSSAQACAWSGVPPTSAPGLCTTFAAIGVDLSALRIAVVSGANQTVMAPAIFAPVVFRVVDAEGHPVAGAQVNVYQTVDALEMSCPARGPCPIPPVLARSTANEVSDVDGLVSVMPMQLAQTGEVTNMAVAAGTQGFSALSVVQQP